MHSITPTPLAFCPCRFGSGEGREKAGGPSSCPSGGTGILFLGRSSTTVLWGGVLCSFYVGLRLALGSHSWGWGRGQSPDLGLGRSWRNIPQQGLGRPRESRLTHSGQRRSCLQARGGRHLVSDTGLAIVCRDLSQLYLAHRGEKEKKCKKKKKIKKRKERKPQETLHLESPECVVDFPTRAGADLGGTVQCSGFFVKEQR